MPPQSRKVAYRGWVTIRVKASELLEGVSGVSQSFFAFAAEYSGYGVPPPPEIRERAFQ